MGFIYKITNKINGKNYIGQTKRTVEIRWKEHLREKDNAPIHKAIQKYGENNFFVTVLEECENHLLNEREIYWINYYDSYNGHKGYNATKGGQNIAHIEKWMKKHPNQVKQNLEKARQKSIEKFESNIELKNKREQARQQGYQNYIKNNHEQWLKQQQQKLEKAREVLKEQYQKDPSKIIKRAQENGKRASRPVYQLDKETKKIIHYFESCSDAAKYLNKNGGHSNISKACKTGRIAYGYYWAYA